MQSPRKGSRPSRKRTGLLGSGVSARIVWKDFHSGMVIIRGRTPGFHERKLRGSDVSARIFGKDFLSGMVIIRGRELKMHERELRGSEVSRGDFNPGVITFDVILILCDSASLRLWAFSPSLWTGTHLRRVRDWSGIL